MTWILSKDRGETRIWKKTVLKTGEFEKSSTGEEFTIDLAFLDHLSRTFGDWTSDGHQVPVPVG